MAERRWFSHASQDWWIESVQTKSSSRGFQFRSFPSGAGKVALELFLATASHCIGQTRLRSKEREASNKRIERWVDRKWEMCRESVRSLNKTERCWAMPWSFHDFEHVKLISNCNRTLDTKRRSSQRRPTDLPYSKFWSRSGRVMNNRRIGKGIEKTISRTKIKVGVVSRKVSSHMKQCFVELLLCQRCEHSKNHIV